MAVVATEQEKFWRGTFGDEYTKRCRPDPKQRASFWELVLEQTAARSVLEVGCNRGTNLISMRTLDPTLQLLGVDVNADALKEANAQGIDAREMPADEVGRTWPQRFDLTFTAGVLIHIPPEALEATMKSIIGASKKWVLAVEYQSLISHEIDYRGHAERLWKRPYGALYESLDLVLHSMGELGTGDGFDSCCFWLMRRKAA